MGEFEKEKKSGRLTGENVTISKRCIRLAGNQLRQTREVVLRARLSLWSMSIIMSDNSGGTFGEKLSAPEFWEVIMLHPPGRGLISVGAGIECGG